MIERIDHVNIVVDDMQKMVAFYTEVLGMRQTRQAVIAGSWIDAVTGLSPVEADVVFLEAGGETTIELLCYRQPGGSARLSGLDRPNVQGYRHIALLVTDIEPLVAAIEAAGIKMIGAIQQVPDAQVEYGAAKKHLVYFRDPEGNLLELCAYY